MGTWGHGLFDDDLALDVKASFDRAVAGGASAAEAAAGLMESELAREVLGEAAEGAGDPARDEAFWEESRGLFYAIASLQCDHGVLQEAVRQQTLQAIAVERRGLDPERDPARWAALDALAARLSRGPDEAPAMRHVAAMALAAPDDDDDGDSDDDDGDDDADDGDDDDSNAVAPAGDADDDDNNDDDDADDDSNAVAPDDDELPRHRLAEGTNPALNLEQVMARPPAKRASTRKPAGAAAARKPASGKPAKRPASGKPAKRPAPGKPAKRPAPGKPAKRPASGKPAKRPVAKRPVVKKPAKKAPAKRGRRA